MKKFVIIIVVFSFLLSGCSEVGFTRYSCQEFSNWDNSECNPPKCYQDYTCTKDLFPDDFWDKIEQEGKVPPWIEENFQQYVTDQNYRYINSLFNSDVFKQIEIQKDAERVGYLLIPSKYLGGVSNEEQV
jgi:hypothetical protein